MYSTGFRILTAIAFGYFATQATQAQTITAPVTGNVTHYAVGGIGGWDLLAVQPEKNRLFISRSDRVQVFETQSGKVVKEIPGTSGVHGIALANELGLGFTSNGQSNSVTVFDLNSLNVIGEIKGIGAKPDAILYEPHSKRVFVFNGRSRGVTVIDAVTKKIVSTIALPGKPELAVLDGKGNIFVNIEDKNSISKVDVLGSKVTVEWPLTGCEGPTGLAIDARHDRLFAVCDNHKMVVVDANSGAIVSEVGIGARPDGAAFDSKLSLVLSSNGDGTLSAIHEESPDHYSPVATISTQKGARTIALDEKTHRAYLVTSEFGPTPPATAEQPHPRPIQIPGTFAVLVVDLAALQ
jgi:DNA-binding beta-propeller fold protein YncE